MFQARRVPSPDTPILLLSRSASLMTLSRRGDDLHSPGLKGVRRVKAVSSPTTGRGKLGVWPRERRRGEGTRQGSRESERQRLQYVCKNAACLLNVSLLSAPLDKYRHRFTVGTGFFLTPDVPATEDRALGRRVFPSLVAQDSEAQCLLSAD